VSVFPSLIAFEREHLDRTVGKRAATVSSPRIATAPTPYVAKRIAELAAAMPELDALSPDQVDTVMRAVVFGELTAAARRRIVAARIDWDNETGTFIATKTSPHTQAAYARALAILKKWLDLKNLRFTELSSRVADEFIQDLRAARRDNGQAMDADSIRLVIAVCSTFYTFLERRFDDIRSPFRGTRARPIATLPVAEIPSEKETLAIIGAADPITRAALLIVTETGLRIGGLPGLVIRKDGSWWTMTKGKRFYGLEMFTSSTLKAIRAASLDPHHPFLPATFPHTLAQRRAKGPLTENQVIQRLKQRIHRTEKELLGNGKIAAVYSWQDYRHAYAARNAQRGITWLAAHLGHSSIAITERYLRNVLAIDTRKL
jgi:integrase